MTVEVGTLLQQWRSRRSISQLDLAYEVGVSPKHLSFVETGKSRPSPALLHVLAERLDIPLRERNSLLLAAGHAPRYSEEPLDSETMTRVRAEVRRLLDAHNPNMGMALDRAWNVVLANDTAMRLLSLLPEELQARPVNLFRVSLHPDGFAQMTNNFDEWATYLLDLLRRMVRITGDERLAQLEREISSYPTVAGLDGGGASTGTGEVGSLLVPLELALGDQVLSFFSTLTTFGSPRDVTLEELTIELFYPADEPTEQWVAMMQG
ncbi:helix-turn-helix transcriptional regulator [Gordonia rubripertincta]|uniref:Helix-turn-helix transcriptional regulator n=2 Tax=Gordonia rubripertincta TaxID=36822 RepID=A0AAW4G757_GORRU|nr:helix-turn-helix transcriptional regulator [Gordonia rubripertincta]MBM7278910.1 helix-turn-helix transcriptional regulator [Gordonia rubripertincta]MDG6781484.1 helix-turn-helix transcriptional regulator [Gordonia rubripertincta]NKY61356.1 helix-turn-helix transcriptional regulator [Gordonia rubripertincta]NKY61743.1 helix-turn-helix transcriptional regulator [Gordonia rubripertincta]QMU19737.1 helix-turn-helix transcriptional regulator [Gordonia rubripertincta]